MGQFASIPAVVGRDDPALRRESKACPQPMSNESKIVVHKMIDTLKRDKCPQIVDMISAPMLGHNLRIIALHMQLRASHMRGLDEDSSQNLTERVIVMVNPQVEKEPHSESSF